MNDKAPTSGERIPSRRATNALLLGAAVFVLFMAALSGIGAHRSSWHRTASPDLDAIARAAALTFPPSARLVHSHFDQFQEDHLFAQVEMDAHEVKKFTGSLPPYRRLSPREINAAFSPGRGAPPWWDPKVQPKSIAVRCLLRDLTSVYILINGGGSGQRTTIYLFWIRA